MLETIAAGAPLEGRTELFVTPGFAFCRVDGLVTNFHLPRSTLLAHGNHFQSIAVHNVSFASLRLLSSNVALQVGDDPFPPRCPIPLANTVVPARHTLWLRFMRGGCPPRAIELRYVIFGTTVQQTIVPDACP